MVEVLREGFLRERAPDTAIAVLKWMDAHEIQIRDPGARERRRRMALASGMREAAGSETTVFRHASVTYLSYAADSAGALKMFS